MTTAASSCSSQRLQRSQRFRRAGAAEVAASAHSARASTWQPAPGDGDGQASVDTRPGARCGDVHARARARGVRACGAVRSPGCASATAAGGPFGTYKGDERPISRDRRQRPRRVEPSQNGISDCGAAIYISKQQAPLERTRHNHPSNGRRNKRCQGVGGPRGESPGGRAAAGVCLGKLRRCNARTHVANVPSARAPPPRTHANPTRCSATLAFGRFSHHMRREAVKLGNEPSWICVARAGGRLKIFGMVAAVSWRAG